MAKLTIELSDPALAHAEEMAKTYGFKSAAEHVREWLTNTAANYEKQKKQKEITKLEAKINSDTAALYEEPAK